MRRDFSMNLDFDPDFCDTFGDFDNEDQATKSTSTDKVAPIHAQWDIVTAFNVINENAPKSLLNKNLYIKCAEAFHYLSERLGLNAIQCIVIAMLIEEGKAMSFRQMGRVLGLSRLTMMTYYRDIDELFQKRWIQHRGTQEEDGTYESYALAKGVVGAIRENRPFEPEVLECADTQEFVERLANHIALVYSDDDSIFDDARYWIKEIVMANKDLPICKVALELNNLDSMILLMLVVADYCNFNGAENEGIGPGHLQLVYPCEITPHFSRMTDSMQKGTHQLFQENLIEHKCLNGMADINRYVASKLLKSEILADFLPMNHADNRIPKINGLKSHKDIVAKTLFYNPKECEQMDRLRKILSQEQLPIIQERLKSKGMRTGVCILMHGHPGTGKTATAFELARQTGRDIIQVQVTDFKDKFVGESEAKLKGLFNNYRHYCKNTEVTPILLLNEGDAILSRRTENVENSVEQTMNALQNILLEEMENLQGIMIVTTNLTSNLDKAFERRFIFKVNFEKPCAEVKARIWQSMIDSLNKEEASKLADMFDVTGGEIENIARKSTMEYILTGQEADFETIKKFTKQEKMESSRKSVIGFTIHKQ